MLTASAIWSRSCQSDRDAPRRRTRSVGLERGVGKPLGRELAGYHSARRGPYRLLYRIDDEAQAISVHRVGHRADVYRYPSFR
ncbi:MAG: type II toxin-antitoxin system RelE/ParE family toxin [Mycobacterium sp.]|nr:type II toxin-antitoxin system RelE/ParE family toxin [Mycobacterium sp.]